MKQTNIRRVFLLLVTAALCTMQAFANSGTQSKEKDIKLLQTFYTKYISYLLENKDKQAEELMKSYCTKEMQDKWKIVGEEKDYDLFINAQDVDKEMITTLHVMAGEKPGWYIVSYEGLKYNEIVVQLKSEGGKTLISDVVPTEIHEFIVLDKKPDIQREDGVYFYVDKLPEFPGGAQAMQDFIMANFKKPANSPKGHVLVGFVIKEDGAVSEVKVVRSLNEAADNEAMRVVKLMPKWKPAQVDGKSVAMVYSIPFTIK